MNNIEQKANWEEKKSRLKKKFAALTDNDLIFEEGNQQEMFDRLLIKLGKTKEELRNIIAGL